MLSLQEDPFSPRRREGTAAAEMAMKRIDVLPGQ